jgi:transposase
MENDEFIREAYRLRMSGYTYQEIADTLQVSKGTVYRRLKHYETVKYLETEEHSVLKQEKHVQTSLKQSSEQVSPVSAEEHFVAETDLKQNETEKHAETEIKQPETDVSNEKETTENLCRNKPFNPLTFTAMNQPEMTNTEILNRPFNSQNANSLPLPEDNTGIKGMLLMRANKLILELIKFCRGYKWHTTQISEFLEKVDNLKQRIEDFADRNSIDFKELAIYQALGYCESEVNATVISEDVKKTDFWFTDEQLQILAGYSNIKSFDQKINTPLANDLTYRQWLEELTPDKLPYSLIEQIVEAHREPVATETEYYSAENEQLKAENEAFKTENELLKSQLEHATIQFDAVLKRAVSSGNTSEKSFRQEAQKALEKELAKREETAKKTLENMPEQAVQPVSETGTKKSETVLTSETNGNSKQ